MGRKLVRSASRETTLLFAQGRIQVTTQLRKIVNQGWKEKRLGSRGGKGTELCRLELGQSSTAVPHRHPPEVNAANQHEEEAQPQPAHQSGGGQRQSGPLHDAEAIRNAAVEGDAPDHQPQDCQQHGHQHARFGGPNLEPPQSFLKLDPLQEEADLENHHLHASSHRSHNRGDGIDSKLWKDLLEEVQAPRAQRHEQEDRGSGADAQQSDKDDGGCAE